ncbi:response regulator [candidate division KSB1 bacterium]|nr:response regulator [candidate division KSB1 bacterium]NIR72030.1 response regulator [candidate division KSB1 bacterium]NIS25971.1 response regulator [candidate division KSB1 bacterium]NIT74942.1 response regulator [candidate division KSB1 bacterium]NIU28726.1 response regulator [candidate division KSB1 bacterium]
MNNKCDILVVEDEPVVIDAAKKILVPEGYKVDDAEDAESALHKLEGNKYHVILSDLMLPNITGLGLLERVKCREPAVPVVMITGYATLENAVKSFKDGAFDFIPKPFDMEELLGVVYRARKFFELSRNRKDSLAEVPGMNDEAVKSYFLGDHAFASLAEDGSVLFAVGKTFPKLMGEVKDVELPEVDTEVLQGNPCVKIITRNKLVHKVWAPLSGRVIEINHKLEEDTGLIDSDPFDQGWLVRVIPTNLENELENLTPRN